MRVLHLTDTHVKEQPTEDHMGLADGVRQLRGESTLDALRHIVDDLATRERFDLVVHTGDVSDDGSPESTAACFAELARLGAPVLVVAGNHDDPEILGAATGSAADGVQVRQLGEWTVLGLCSAKRGQECGTLGTAQLAELRDAIAAASGPVALALHHPPLSSCDHVDCQLTDADDLLAIVEDHDAVRLVLSGHLHQAADRCERGAEFLLGPSTCLQLQHIHPLSENNPEPTPLGARLIELDDDGSITAQLEWW